jgi:hypothetical protein
MDEVGTMYLKRAYEMSEDLGLFGPTYDGEGTNMGKARIFTAWAIFSWQATFNFAFFRPPDLEQPPQLLLPDPEVEPQWYPEIWIQYPYDQTAYPLHLGHKMKAETALHTIMNELGSLAFGNASLSQSSAVDDIVVLKQKLDVWKESLPEPLQPKKLVFPFQLSLQ